MHICVCNVNERKVLGVGLRHLPDISFVIHSASLWLVFSFLTNFVLKAVSFILMKCNESGIKVDHVYSVISKESLPNPRSQRLFYLRLCLEIYIFLVGL